MRPRDHNGGIIIDAHCHYGSGNGFTGPWDTRADLRSYLVRARRAGISRVALIPALSPDYRRGNSEIARLIERKPGCFYGFAAVNPAARPGHVLRYIAPLVRDHGFIGIKVHHYNGRITREVCQAALQLRVPILWDVGDDVYAAELAADEFPAVNFIVPHLGSFGDTWRAQRACIDLLKRYRNVYTDSAGVRRFDLLAEAVKTAGPDRVLFGSDGPWLHPAVELEKIRQLRLRATEEDLLLSGNFLRLTAAARRHHRMAEASLDI